MKFQLQGRGDYEEWRVAARQALAANIPPNQVEWQSPDTIDLFAGISRPALCNAEAGTRKPVVNSVFLEISTAALCHSEPSRFDLCYRVLWRLQTEKRLFEDVADADIVQLNKLAKSVARDAHKMKAFVRFREVRGGSERRSFVAWFEPEHFIVARTAPFFSRRFSDMDWLIATPKGSAAWDGKDLHLSYEAAERPVGTDETDDLWRTYYANIFNPARLKIDAMQSEMPKKYWKNLPEAELIPDLIRSANSRVQAMHKQGPSVSAPAFHTRRYGKT